MAAVTSDPIPQEADFQVQPLHTQEERQAMYELRRKVFVEEQQVDPALEFDEHEEVAVHYIGKLREEVIACARWRPINEAQAKIERCAVLPAYRGRGLGHALVARVVRAIPGQYTVYLHAQHQAVSFYQKLGFTAVGEAFYEAGILHYEMILHSVK
jgi:predicted GNAT family N-acyltransferase